MARSRLFVGWTVPDGAAASLAALGLEVRRSLEHAGGRARWERREKLHATLQFLGDTDDAAVPALGAALAAAAAAHPAFALRFEGVGAFPPRGRPRVLFAAVGEGAAALTALAASVQEALVRAGAPRPDKPFHPHVTLARVTDPPRGRWAFDGAAPSVPARVERIALVRSELHAAGASHTALVEAALAAAG